jgi:hypothetical protein
MTGGEDDFWYFSPRLVLLSSHVVAYGLNASSQDEHRRDVCDRLHVSSGGLCGLENY